MPDKMIKGIPFVSLRFVVEACGKNLNWESDSRTASVGKMRLYYENGDTYFGHVINMLADGEGTREYINIGTYTGEFNNGVREGQGKLTWLNGDTYEGEWLNGKFEDYGVYRSSQELTEGDWIDDELSGYATVSWIDGPYKGDKYTGEVTHFKFNGKGTYYYHDGLVFTGEWKDGICHGPATLMEPNGNQFNGFYNDNSFTGNGTVTINRTTREVVWNGNQYTFVSLQPIPSQLPPTVPLTTNEPPVRDHVYNPPSNYELPPNIPDLQLETGMPMDVIRGQFGEPTRKEVNGSQELWIYEGPGGKLTITSEDGKFVNQESQITP